MTHAKEKVRHLKENAQAKAKRLKKKLEVPNNNLFVVALLSWILFLLVELTLRIYDLYRDAPWVDIPSHLTAGVALAMLFTWVASLTSLKNKNLSVMVMVFVATILWEISETLQEMVFWNPPYLRDYFLWDGFFDVIVGLIGAGLAMIVFRRVKRDNAFIAHIEV